MSTPYKVAAEVLAVVQDALTVAGRPVGESLVMVGGVVVDDCCAGLLSVSIERVWRGTSPFPIEAVADEACEDGSVNVSLVVRVDRCVPVMDSDGAPPTIAAQESGYCSVLDDAAVVWNAVTSAEMLGVDAYGEPVYQRALVSQTFAGPEGGCVGVETRFTLGRSPDGWCTG